MIAEASLTCRIEYDRAAEQSGSDALAALGEAYPGAIVPLMDAIAGGVGFDVVRFRTEHGSILLRLKPSGALLWIVEAFGGLPAREALLGAYGFDLDLRAA